MMRYRLRTLMIVSGVAPPAIAFLWFNWRSLLVCALIVALFALWFWVSLSLARFCGWLVASTME
jgi:hypothetical protein